MADNAGKPFFLYVPFNAVHAPHQVPAKYLEPYTANLQGERRKYAGMLAAMDEATARSWTRSSRPDAEEHAVHFSSDNGGPPGEVTNNGKFGRARRRCTRAGCGRRVASWEGHIPAGVV